MVKNLRVGFLINEYETINGLSRYVSSLYPYLNKIPGLDVQLIPLMSRSIPKIVINAFRYFGLDPDTFFKAYPVVWPELDVDIVHLTHRTLATLLWRKPRFPVVVTVHDIIHYTHRNNPALNYYRRKGHRMVDVAAVRALKKADALLASSEYTRQSLINEIGLSSGVVHKIYLGVDSNKFHPVPVPKSFFNRYRLNSDSRYILHVGTVEARKNLDKLIDAFRLISVRMPDLKLLHVGHSQYPDQLSKLKGKIAKAGLQKDVKFIDGVSDDDLVYFYNSAHVFVFPSLAEGFGFPILEALACGTPVVCSNKTSMPELVDDAALVTDPNDIDGLAEAIEETLSSVDTRHRLREGGFLRVSQFNWLKTARDTKAVYRSLL